MIKTKEKILAVLSAGAIMSFMAGFAPEAGILSNALTVESYAASGWQQNNGEWYYYASNGSMVTDEMKKSGDNWYYLSSDGTMQKNYLYEDDSENLYYFNEDGAMVTDSWVSYADDGSEYRWYYFDGSGKAARKSSDSDNIYTRSIDGKTYSFDEDGKMLYGWADEDGELIDSDSDDPFEDARYYFGDADDGVMRKNQWLEYEDGSEGQSNIGDLNGEKIQYEDLDTLWFFFESSGKKVIPADDKESIEKTINGNKYVFDKNGVMLSDWVVTTSSTASPSYKFFSDDLDGHLKKNTWVYAIPSEEMDSEAYDDEEYKWFYADGSGKAYTNGIKKVGGKKYAFNSKGIMQTEFVTIDPDDDTETKVKSYSVDDDDLSSDDFKDRTSAHYNELSAAPLYYFDPDDEKGGYMRTGKSVKIELGDDTFLFGFDKNGKAYGSEGKLELVNKKYYINGLLLAADRELKYGVIEDENGDYVVVNSSGNIQKGNEKALKDGQDGYILITNDKYYGYCEDDHKPVWKDGIPYYYDSDEDDNMGDIIADDGSGADNLPDEDMVLYRG